MVNEGIEIQAGVELSLIELTSMNDKCDPDLVDRLIPCGYPGEQQPFNVHDPKLTHSSAADG